MALKRPAIFIDKDGTLLENVPYNVDPALVRLTPNAVDGLRLLHDAGYALVLVSNQSGIARGVFEEPALLAVIEHVCDRLAAEGVPLAACYYCPHHPSGAVSTYARECDCRKPRPGLITRAAADHRLDLARSYLIGDILDDVEAGHNAGCRTVLLDRGSETEWRPGPGRDPDHVAGDLLEAARIIVDDPSMATVPAGGARRAR